VAGSGGGLPVPGSEGVWVAQSVGCCARRLHKHVEVLAVRDELVFPHSQPAALERDGGARVQEPLDLLARSRSQRGVHELLRLAFDDESGVELRISYVYVLPSKQLRPEAAFLVSEREVAGSL
jgi:hypothetical protein